MPLTVRAQRIVEDRRPMIGKGEVTDTGRQRKGLREISNIPNNVAKKVADLKISTNVTHQDVKNSKTTTKKAVTSTVQKTQKHVEKKIPNTKLAQPKVETIEDIDKLQEGNVFLVNEYAKDVYSYLMTLEMKFGVDMWPIPGSKVTENMRTILVDWLIDVHVEFHLLQETIHTAVSILDRYLQVDTELGKNVFQLAGVSSLSLATKYEEILAPTIEDFIYLCKNTYSKKELLEMEKKILKSINYDLGKPCSIIFLRRYNMAAKADKLQHTYSKFIIDMVLLDSKFCHIRPSLIGAAASFIAMCIMKKTYDSSLWTSVMVHYSTYTFADIQPIASLTADLIIKVFKSKHDSVRRKYAESTFLGVSMKILASMDILKKIASDSVQ